MDSRGAAFVCQSCRARLVLVRSDKADDVEQRGEPWPGAGLGVSVYDSGGVEESFIVLNERRSQAAGAFSTCSAILSSPVSLVIVGMQRQLADAAAAALCHAAAASARNDALQVDP